MQLGSRLLIAETRQKRVQRDRESGTQIVRAVMLQCGKLINPIF